MSDEVIQNPVGYRKVRGVLDALAIVSHPAFRIGFLDAHAGRPHDHDSILDRINKETPASALRRIRWSADDMLADRYKRTEVAQYRYEEGRRLALEWGVRCKSWNHPDYPPAQVRAACEVIVQRAAISKAA